MSTRKQAYLDGLKALEAAEQEGEDAGAPAPSSAPNSPAPSPAPAAATPDAPSPAPAPIAAPTPAAPPDPLRAAVEQVIPGFGTLPETTQKDILDRWGAAERLKAAEAEKSRLEHERQQLHARVGPQERQLQALRSDLAKLQQQQRDVGTQQQQGKLTALKQRIESIRTNYPDDAELFEGVLSEAQAALNATNEVRNEVAELRKQNARAEQIRELSAAHPKWQEKRVKVVLDPASGQHVVQPNVDTPEAREVAAWANGLDPYERNLLWPMTASATAADAIYFLNRFEHDRAQAWAEFERIRQGQNGQHATQTTTASPAPAAPVVDPDPSRRATAPTVKSAGQPMSDKKRELIAAADFLQKRQQAAAPRR